MDVSHTAIWVSDLEKTKDFYIDALGLEHSWDFTDDNGVLNFYVKGEDYAEIQFKYDPEEQTEVQPEGMDHIAISVSDVDHEFERMLEETGCDVVMKPTDFPQANRRAAFIEDPDGYVVELVQKI